MTSHESGGSPTFKRGYVACDSCRSRKVRCVLDGEPPCKKCKREHRDCQFDHRSKASKQRERPKWAAPPSGEPASSTTSMRGMKRRRSEAHLDSQPLTTSRSSPQDLATLSQETSPFQLETPGSLSDLWQATSDPGQPTSRTPETLLSDRVVSTILTGSNDALNVLSDTIHPPPQAAASTASYADSTKPIHANPELPTVVPNAAQSGSQGGIGFLMTNLSEPSEATLDIWDKCRFVRQGFFTGQEAVSYIDCFFKHLAPLSAIVLDQYRSHSGHSLLIYEEPMLLCTLLLISSRFFMLPGPGGASRSHFVHNRLWHYTEFLIKRILYGVEKLSTAKTRNLGTIESLMLLSEWHPRALHFPPESEGWDRLLTSYEPDPSSRTRRNNEEPATRWLHDVIEPAKSANRMSWMLLGTATNLGHELGVFSSERMTSMPQSHDEACRRHRARRLLYTLVTQTATRLGYQSIFPESIVMEASRPHSNQAIGASDPSWTAYMNSWAELTRLSCLAASMFFSSTSQLQRQLMDDAYLNLLENFSSSLTSWRETYDKTCQDVSFGLGTILLIEYHHLKACSSAIAIQAVVQRAASLVESRQQKESLSAFMTTRDKVFLQDVVADSSMVLQLATMSDFRSQLPMAPARTRISVISASVFLLKALNIGSSDTNAHAALDILEKSTAALQDLPPDDMDFATRYATLIEKFTANFRASLLSGNASLSCSSRGQAVSSASSAMEPVSTEATVELPTSFPSLQDGQMNETEGMDFQFATGMHHDFWKTISFDSSIAPFGTGADQLSQGLDADSLNFLWNLPDLG